MFEIVVFIFHIVLTVILIAVNTVVIAVFIALKTGVNYHLIAFVAFVTLVLIVFHIAEIKILIAVPNCSESTNSIPHSCNYI